MELMAMQVAKLYFWLLQDLFISEVLDKNIGLKRSFENQFITATNYALTFSNQKTKKRSNYIFVRFFSESSGNILNAYNKSFN